MDAGESSDDIDHLFTPNQWSTPIDRRSVGPQAASGANTTTRGRRTSSVYCIGREIRGAYDSVFSTAYDFGALSPNNSAGVVGPNVAARTARPLERYPDSPGAIGDGRDGDQDALGEERTVESPGHGVSPGVDEGGRGGRS